MSGSYAIIGASGNDDAGNLSGSAYIFERVSEGDWGIGTKLLASDAAAGDYFGIDVGISGTRAIVGAYNDDDAGTSSGSAYIFERVGEGDWGTGTKLVAPDASTNSLYGNSVGIDGSRCIVGAFYVGSGMGAAYIYERVTEGDWGSGTKIVAPDAGSGDQFGESVALSGSYAIVGACYNDDTINNSGSAYIFERAAEGDWGTGTKFVAADPGNNDKFGEYVSIDQGNVIIGAKTKDDANGADSGAVYIFSFTLPVVAIPRTKTLYKPTTLNNKVYDSHTLFVVRTMKKVKNNTIDGEVGTDINMIFRYLLYR